MSDKSAIEWTDATWNPTVGCSIVSPGCTNCYAMKVTNGLERRFDSPKYRGLTKAVNGNAVWTGEVRLDEAALLQPLKWKRGRKIFVNSMSDLFHESLSDADIDRVFAVMARCPQHTFQVLTKRAKRMQEYMSRHDVGARWAIAATSNDHMPTVADAVRWGNDGLPNVWLGVSAEQQREADERIPLLERTPAAVKFLSLEPLLGPINLTRCGSHYTGSGPLHLWQAGGDQRWRKQHMHPAPEIQWVIVGGESGNSARIMHPKWARSLRDQCDAADVPFFFKQWGEWAAADKTEDGFVSAATGEMGLEARWGQETFSGDGAFFARVGRNAAGRMLDGREHNEFPVTDSSVTKLATASHESKAEEAAHS